MELLWVGKPVEKLLSVIFGHLWFWVKRLLDAIFPLRPSLLSHPKNRAT